MILDFILLILIVRYLKRTFETAVTLPGWDKIFTVIFYASIGFMIITALFHQVEFIMVCAGHVILLFILYILFAKKEFLSARSYMIAIAPYIIISLIKDIIKYAFPVFYEHWHNYPEIAEVFTVIWLISMLIVNKRQQKALLNEKLKTRQEEEQNKIMSKLKSELEIQVKERTAEITKQKEELQQALNDLKSTQSQLIQSEKMASLGELTAGIAHEIQNPLNFVNNFSEVSNELIVEMVDEVNKGNMVHAKTIANDLKINLEKINHHGKRADAIVKGMLQHSRKSNGKKELTDINKLADEYVRLAYHGLRAKDKSFNATLKTDFDETIGNISIIPQDIGRVILNLITNAFYAVAEKKKQGLPGYEPTVSVSIKHSLLPLRETGGEVLITVSDNGNGIPEKILDKIFQPFFTTKPTGQGTGLGLSLSYDIIKTHGGKLRVENRVGGGASFIVQLPIRHT